MIVTTRKITSYYEVVIWVTRTEIENLMERTYHLGEGVCVVNQAVQSCIYSWYFSFNPCLPFLNIFLQFQAFLGAFLQVE